MKLGTRDDGEVSSPAADLADRSGPAQSAGWSMGLLNLGRIATLAALVLCVGLQQINHDFFPPSISVSQYGIGPHGWLFTLWTAVTVVASLAIWRANPQRQRAAGYLLTLGGVALLVMGVVRTDAGGLQHSWHAKVHMYASILALVAVPIGLAIGLRWAQTRWRRIAWCLVAISDAALIMVLVSAAGVATPGWDAPHSWALWQAVAVTMDMLVLAIFALATFSPPGDLSVRA